MSSVGQSIQSKIAVLSLSRLVATPRGRHFLFGFLADAEASDENAVFDTLAARIDDPRLQRLVKRHQDDEFRHARLMREACVRAHPGPLPEIPDTLRVVFRIDHHAGGVAAKFAANSAGIMETCVLLQVMEERAVREYPALVRALQPVDPAAARALADIVRDEIRHVKYVQAISRRYAPDAQVLEATLARYRRAEQRAFIEHRAAFLAHVVEHDLLGVGRAQRRLWRLIAAFALWGSTRRRDAPGRTPVTSAAPS